MTQRCSELQQLIDLVLVLMHEQVRQPGAEGRFAQLLDGGGA